MRALSNSGDSPLHASATEGHLGNLRAIIHAVKNVEVDISGYLNEQNNSGYTPLMWAASKGHAKAAALLLDSGANLMATTPDGDTVLHVAASNGQNECITLLLEASASRLHFCVCIHH
jgi:ankyrin repeat protein